MNIRDKASEIYHFSSAPQNTDTLHPFVTLIGCTVFLICVASLERYALIGLLPYAVYAAVLLLLARVPVLLLLRRTAIALPFCLFAGISNLFLERTPMLRIGQLTLTAGMLSCMVILLRTVLCVSAVLLLIAVTPFADLMIQLRRLHVPEFFLQLLELTYRYIGVLAEEASAMYTAYRLRARAELRGIDMRHMGSFIGVLLLRSIDRAERIYQAMQCRGYPRQMQQLSPQRLQLADILFLLSLGMFCIVPRFL